MRAISLYHLANYSPMISFDLDIIIVVVVVRSLQRSHDHIDRSVDGRTDGRICFLARIIHREGKGKEGREGGRRNGLRRIDALRARRGR